MPRANGGVQSGDESKWLQNPCPICVSKVQRSDMATYRCRIRVSKAETAPMAK